MALNKRKSLKSRIFIVLNLVFLTFFHNTIASAIPELDLPQLEYEDELMFLTQQQEDYETRKERLKELGLWEKTTLEEVTRLFSGFSSQQFSFASLNFGIVAYNKYHKIYRSQALGARGANELFKHMQRNKLALPSKVIFTNLNGYKASYFGSIWSEYSHYFKGITHFALEEAKLFSTATHPMFKDVEFHHPLNDNVLLSGINAAEDLRVYEIDEVADSYTKVYFKKQMSEAGISNIIYSSRENFIRVLDLILENKQAVLFHCTGGIHRTGSINLALRYIEGGIWTIPFETAIKVRGVRGIGYVSLTNLAEVEYYLHNPYNVRAKNFKAIKKFAGLEGEKADKKFADYVSKYRATLRVRPS